MTDISPDKHFAEVEKAYNVGLRRGLRNGLLLGVVLGWGCGAFVVWWLMQ